MTGTVDRDLGPVVALVPVDDAVLEELVLAATERADADEVTPPAAAPDGPSPDRPGADESAADGAGTGWSPQRVAWLRSYHRGCRAGLDGPGQEATWAVLLDARVVGAVRLAAASTLARRSGATGSGVVETGVWLVRDVRGRGLAHAVVARVLEQAAASGASAVVARTTAGNLGALAVLRGAGFTLTAGAGGAVDAVHEV